MIKKRRAQPYMFGKGIGNMVVKVAKERIFPGHGGNVTSSSIRASLDTQFRRAFSSFETFQGTLSGGSLIAGLDVFGE